MISKTGAKPKGSKKPTYDPKAVKKLLRQGVSTSEGADLLGISQSTFWRAVYRARRRPNFDVGGNGRYMSTVPDSKIRKVHKLGLSSIKSGKRAHLSPSAFLYRIKKLGLKPHFKVGRPKGNKKNKRRHVNSSLKHPEPE